MRALNEVKLIGNIGNIESKPGKYGRFTTLSICTDESYTKDGHVVEKSEWHNITFNENAGEILLSMAKKGTKLYVCGSLRTKKYTTKSGDQASRTYIQGEDFLVLSNGIERGQSNQNHHQNSVGNQVDPQQFHQQQVPSNGYAENDRFGVR